MMRTPRFWHHRGLLSTLLLPASALYALGFMLDRTFAKKRKAELPVIAIGNLTAGGAGKTPTCIALVPMLRELGAVPHIVSRGYGGKKNHAYRVDPAHDSAADVGDEALLLAAAAPTWVGADRHASIRAAKAAGATLILADDALQHHALAADLELLIVDGATGFGNGRLLPAGPLREPIRAGNRIILQIGAGQHALKPDFTAQLVPSAPADFLQGPPWLAFAGIGHPEKFYTTLRQLGATLTATRDFADHHPYSPAELQALLQQAASLNARLITTEKDAVRLAPEWRAQVSVLPVRIELGEPDALRARLAPLLFPPTGPQ